MMSIQKRKSSTCVPEKNRKRSKRPSGSELTNQPSQQKPQQHTDDSVWIFGLINNIEQLLSTFNGTCSASSTASSGTSTPSSASSPASSSGSCRSSYQPATCASSPSGLQPGCGPAAATASLPRHSLSRQIKFHEYKGPPTARRASASAKQAATSTGNSQPVELTKQPAQLAHPLVHKAKLQSTPPAQVHHQLYQHHQEQPCGQQQHQHQQLASQRLISNSSLPLTLQQPTAGDLPQFHSAAQCSMGPTNQLTSAGELVPPSLSCSQNAPSDNNKTRAPAPSSLDEAELRAVDVADRLAWRLPEHSVYWQTAAHQQPLIQELSLQPDKLPARGQATAFALSTDSDQETDTNEIEPSIDFGLGGDELLFSEFIDLQDVPLNVEESDWLKKFLPPCSMGG